MEPNFPDSEYLLTDKVSYRLHEPTRGDVIVFKAPINEEEEFIKRIIGLPGDKVSLKLNHVYINGKLLDEKYLASDLITSPGAFISEEQEIEVPKDKYFVLGDNRPHSSDSRSWGFVSKREITGRAWLIYWPIKSAGFIKNPGYNL